MNDFKKLSKNYGDKCAKKISTRLADLNAVNNVAETKFLPGNYHELKGNRHGQYACDLEQPLRLVFIPDHNPVPVNSSGQIQWELVTQINIVEIVDYHK